MSGWRVNEGTLGASAVVEFGVVPAGSTSAVAVVVVGVVVLDAPQLSKTESFRNDSSKTLKH